MYMHACTCQDLQFKKRLSTAKWLLVGGQFTSCGNSRERSLGGVWARDYTIL